MMTLLYLELWGLDIKEERNKEYDDCGEYTAESKTFGSDECESESAFELEDKSLIFGIGPFSIEF